MAEYTKAELDAMTDKAAEAVREGTLDDLQALYADKVAGYLAVQFPGTPGLHRIVLACSQYIAALGVEGVPVATVVHILGAAGLRLEDGQPDDG